MTTDCESTPTLDTTLTKPLHLLETHLLQYRQQICDWFSVQWQKTMPPVYGSVDLRNAGFKLAPIDMNLFPAGFNNLNPESLPLATRAINDIIQRHVPQAGKILLVPESHTRNLKYWSSIQTLQQILIQAGYQVRLGTLGDQAETESRIELSTGESLQTEPLQRRKDGSLVVDGFIPDLVLLNNDLSDGIPAILKDIRQPVLPPASLGWSQRLKSAYFKYYADVVDEFAKIVDIDPWLIAPLFRQCGELDFMARDGMDELIAHAEQLFAEIEAKYAEYGITHKPFLIIKANAGTYGMAVMTVRNIDELRSMNRKQRTRMSTIKGGQSVTSVILQEGVYTFETVGVEKAVAEPVVYLLGCCVVGGFYRIHKERGRDENLNAPGMHFKPLAFSQGCNEPCPELAPDASQNRFYAYGIVAQLSMLAAAREVKDKI